MEEKNAIYQDFDVNAVLTRTFLWMALGLLETFGIGFFVYKAGVLAELASMYLGLVILELAIVVIFNLCFRKLPPTTVAILYFAYAAINGVVFADIFYVFELESVMWTFLEASLLFGIFAYVGKTTKTDLSRFGRMFIYIILAGIIMTIINIFLNIELINIVLNWVLLFVFFGVTAWDMQKITKLGYDGIYPDKIHIYGAMELYLDFINIFIRLLELFGKRRK